MEHSDMNSVKCTAIVLCAGRGSRMKSEIHKQYLLIKDKPVVYYSLKQFQECPFIQEIILVTGREETEYCRREIVEYYDLSKITQIIPGGKERYHSVFEGLKAAKDCSYIFIHDGARPFIDQNMLVRLQKAVTQYDACAAAMPVKDTIKIADEESFAVETPDRSRVWQVQTPQVFYYPLILHAYQKILRNDKIQVTDDAMVLETAEGKKVKLIEGSYQNIKITTPEDLEIAEIFCRNENIYNISGNIIRET